MRCCPQLERPRILDVGRAGGGLSLKLAKLSQGQIVRLATPVCSLYTLARGTRAAGLVGRVAVVSGTLSAIGFRERCFDLRKRDTLCPMPPAHPGS